MSTHQHKAAKDEMEVVKIHGKDQNRRHKEAMQRMNSWHEETVQRMDSWHEEKVQLIQSRQEEKTQLLIERERERCTKLYHAKFYRVIIAICCIMIAIGGIIIACLIAYLLYIYPSPLLICLKPY